MAAKTKMLTVAVDAYFARAIDEALLVTGTYSSRSEFLQNATRKNIAQIRQKKKTNSRPPDRGTKPAKNTQRQGA